MTLFDVFSKREAGGAGLPEQASDAELLAWGEQLRAIADDLDDEAVIDLRSPQPKHAARRPLRAAPLRAAPLMAPPEVLPPPAPAPSTGMGLPRRRAPLRARPLVAPPAAWVER